MNRRFAGMAIILLGIVTPIGLLSFNELMAPSVSTLIMTVGIVEIISVSGVVILFVLGGRTRKGT